MIIKSIKNKHPIFGKNIFIAENATIVGDVTMGDNCSVWFNAVIRGDVNSIVIGDTVNIQDGAVIHCTYQKHATSIGNYVSVGHNALIHGCTIHDHVLVGMGGIVMDGCIVESNTIIAAGAVVTKNTRVEANSIYAGIPAKKINAISKALSKDEIERIANNYTLYASWYK